MNHTSQPVHSSKTTPSSAAGESRTVRVWDPLVRIFHWSLVLFFFSAYLSEDVSDTLHVWSGYAVTLLIIFRLAWGIIGTRHARFTDFVRSPGNVLQYLKDIPTGRAKRYLGHNPAGGAMIIALLVFIAGTVIFGMATLGADENAGPLAGSWLATFNEHTLKEIHEFFANGTLMLVFLHVAGVLFSSVHHRENLVRSMIHGRKETRSDDAQAGE
ncbi:MAG: cytochrome B [Alcanivoracaceae bacterium]|nr:cytochrome B [Alcanivoracaceae bacterium]|tara:strand:+ start:20 stop:661 length:642 start_codon:yes stop_codon:yes gene_type:complete